jgi:hypothetical protein
MFFFKLMQDEHLDATWFSELLLAGNDRDLAMLRNWNIVHLIG